jgi:hypothetical protein
MFLALEPRFADEPIRDWLQPEDDPPDVLCRTSSFRNVGVELGGWLNQQQMKEAMDSKGIERSLLDAVAPQPDNECKNISFAWLVPRSRIRVKPSDGPAFRSEILNLIRDVDRHWESEPFGNLRRVACFATWRRTLRLGNICRWCIASRGALPVFGWTLAKGVRVAWRSAPRWVLFFGPHGACSLRNPRKKDWKILV